MKILLYLMIVSSVLFVNCKEKEIENTTSFVESHDTIIKAVVRRKHTYGDIYYLQKDSTILMEYYSESEFRLFLGTDTTVLFGLDYASDNGYDFNIFYKGKDIGGLYTDTNIQKPNTIAVWFEKCKNAPYNLVDKYFTFRLREEE